MLSLRDYLTQKGQSQVEFAAGLARHLGLPKPLPLQTVSRWYRQQSVPRAKMLRAIAAYTDNQVEPNDWHRPLPGMREAA